MIKLDGVFRDVVSAVALGDGISVRKSLKTTHGTVEKTHEGVHGQGEDAEKCKPDGRVRKDGQGVPCRS
jgi:hypothetical protein